MSRSKVKSLHSATRPSARVSVVILAGGQGKRMRSELPKVLHPLLGASMLERILTQTHQAIPTAAIAVVVGSQAERVRSTIAATAASVTTVTQLPQLGTGHALQCVYASDWGRQRSGADDLVIVLPGDLPLVGADLIAALSAPLAPGIDVRLLTTVLADPRGYGRVIRTGKGERSRVRAIREERDASERERQVTEVAVSIYAFRGSYLAAALPKLRNNNAQGEYYLTDLVGWAAGRSKARRDTIEVLPWLRPADLRGVNDPWELALAREELRERVVRHWAEQGVRFDDVRSVEIEESVVLEAGVRVGAGVRLRGRCHIASGAWIDAHSTLIDTEVAADAIIKQGCVIESSRVGPNASIGPYAHLRPASDVGAHAKIGNFVELKKTRIGEHTSVAHLSYLGDAEVGARVNVGCGFVTCNYDGRVIDGERKHRTTIEDDAFIGSDCQAIAPIRIGRGAYVASGSTLSEDVPADALGIARARQTNKLEYAKKLRPPTGR